jgi:hypothetical protein
MLITSRIDNYIALIYFLNISMYGGLIKLYLNSTFIVVKNVRWGTVPVPSTLVLLPAGWWLELSMTSILPKTYYLNLDCIYSISRIQRGFGGFPPKILSWLVSRGKGRAMPSQ